MKKQLYSLVRGVRNRHVLGFDILVFCIIPTLALLLRVDSFDEAAKYIFPLLVYTAFSILWKLIVFFPAGMYSRYWGFASVDELSAVVVANFVSMMVGVAVFYFGLRPSGILPSSLPQSVPFLDGILTMLICGGMRFGLRLVTDMNSEERDAKEGQHVPKKRALIVGAGVAGSMIIKELRMNPHVPIEPVGFLDDDRTKLGVRIHGIPVIGSLRDLPTAVQDREVQEVIIAMPTASGKIVREVVQMCKTAKVPSKTIPGIFEILGGTAKVSQIREVAIEDLLRRGVVRTDTDGVANLLRDARVMVTGAGGSIGSELCRQISSLRPAELMLVGHGENSIFQIANELRSNYSQKRTTSGAGRTGVKIHNIIADVRDRERMRQVFQYYRPTIVFHAAAHKHVGLMEENIPDAVTNNILGTQLLADLSEEFHVERFVMISSDKAVNPRCIMGVTKRIAEMIVHDAFRRTKRPFVSVRFGNVLGSRGSVVPIFKQQIAQGGPITITHPDVKRYFMTIPEAVQLVLQAAAMGEGGEVFVLDMGEPIRILDLARDIIRLSGMEEGRDIDIVYRGLQRGEKMTEELFFASERVERSNHEKVFVCRGGFGPAKEVDRHSPDLMKKLGHHVARGSSLRPGIELLIAAVQDGTSKNQKLLLSQIVPEYRDDFVEDFKEVLPLGQVLKESVSLTGNLVEK